MTNLFFLRVVRRYFEKFPEHLWITQKLWGCDSFPAPPNTRCCVHGHLLTKRNSERVWRRPISSGFNTNFSATRITRRLGDLLGNYTIINDWAGGWPQSTPKARILAALDRAIQKEQN